VAPDPSLTPELVQAQSFTSGFRGYDQSEVRSFLNRVAAEVRSLRERVEQLESAWHSAEERAARPPVLDEDALMAAVGEETATILRTARAAATEIRAKASEDAERLVAEASAEAERVSADAKERSEQSSRQAQESSDRMVAVAQTDAAQVTERARVEADSIRRKAEQERALTLEGANATRDRILEDLVRRRKVAEIQIEQLRAGRERLMESYAVVRRTLEEAQSELSRADAEARAAADEVGRRLRGVDPSPAANAPARPAKEAPGVILDEAPSTRAEAPLEEAPPEDGGAPETHDASESAQGDLPGPPASASAGDTGSPASAVDELFAKIRSTGRSKSGARKAAKGGGSAAAGATAVADLPQTEARSTDRAEAEPVNGVGVPAAGESGQPSAAEEDGGPREPDADELLLQRRDADLVDLEAGLTRKLKRAMQDEQNDLLDRLRGLKAVPKPSELLPPLDDHLARYEKAAIPLLENAVSAGVSFTSEVLGAEPSDDAAPAVADLAAEAAIGIVEPLRRRLEHAVSAAEAEDQAALIESFGAAYREWKSQRIERISGDVLHAAFSRGTWSAAPDGASLRWIVEDVDGPCPDCDDDALAGLITKGEDFPTGQKHPPAHSGCRCLLVPSAG
jgi:DivIVA domain-containing protein